MRDRVNDAISFKVKSTHLLFLSLLIESKLNTFSNIIINIRLLAGDPSYKVPDPDAQGHAFLNEGFSFIALTKILRRTKDTKIQRGLSITNMMQRDQEAANPAFVRSEVVQERKRDNETIDAIFAAAKSK